jgi:hypothetical protein
VGTQPILEGGAWETVFGKERTYHGLFQQLARGTRNLTEFYNRVLERAGGEIRSVEEWDRRLDEEFAAQRARADEADARRQDWQQLDLPL